LKGGAGKLKIISRVLFLEGGRERTLGTRLKELKYQPHLQQKALEKSLKPGRVV
jgi:hypothetical protein